MFGDLEESSMPSEDNASGQDSFRYRIPSKEMTGAQMEKERREGKPQWEEIGRKSQSSTIPTLA